MFINILKNPLILGIAAAFVCQLIRQAQISWLGKTVFTKGFAAGLGITEPVSSPTFTIVQIYEEGRLPLYHFDVYRIEDIEEMEEIGYEDCFYGEGVCLIEWAELIKEVLPAAYSQITISKDLDKGYDYRKVEIEKR